MKRIISAIALAALALFCSSAVLAQSAGQLQAQNPLTRDIGAIQTLTAAVAGTYNSADQTGFNASRITCVIAQTAMVGSTTTTLKIQNKDAASGQYYTLVTSANVTANGMISPISVGAGITTASNVAANVPLARTWRSQVVVTGSTSVTATVGCTVQ